MPEVQYHAVKIGEVGAVAKQIGDTLHILYDPALSMRARMLAIAAVFHPDEFAPPGSHGYLLDQITG